MVSYHITYRPSETCRQHVKKVSSCNSGKRISNTCSRVNMSSSERRDETSALLDSDSQPNIEENVVDPPVACGSNTEMVSPEVDRHGQGRTDVANVEGNTVAQRNCEENGKHQMYLVAMLMAMLIMVTLAFTQSLSPDMIQNGDSSVSQKTLILYMFVGLLVIFFLLGFYSRITLEVRRARDDGSTRAQKVNKILSNYLSVVGMSFFFPFACALDLCYIVAGTTCDAKWRTLKKLCSAEIYEQYWVDVFYHMTRIVFMGAELLFCLQFHKTRFTTHPLARLGLMLIMVVNIALWFESLVHETEDRGEAMSEDKPKNDNPYIDCVMAFSVNESYNETIELQRCFNGTTDIQKTCSDMARFLYPFTIEFSLLVGEFLAHKFFSCKERNNVNQHPVEIDEDRASDQLRELNGAQNNVETQRVSSTAYLPGSVLIVAIGVSANIAYITLAFFAHAQLSAEEGMPNPIAFFKIYSVFYYALMLTFVILGFVFGCKFELREKRIRGIDYLVLMSAFGPLMYGQIYVTAISRNISGISDNEYGKPRVIIADLATNIVQLSLQAVFVFFADRVKPLTTEQSREILLRHLHGAFKAVVFVMAFYNLTNWVMDSILLANFCFTPAFLKQIFQPGRWFLVDGILLPLTVFSRFNSFLLFTRAYLSLEKASV